MIVLFLDFLQAKQIASVRNTHTRRKCRLLLNTFSWWSSQILDVSYCLPVLMCFLHCLIFSRLRDNNTTVSTQHGIWILEHIYAISFSSLVLSPTPLILLCGVIKRWREELIAGAGDLKEILMMKKMMTSIQPVASCKVILGSCIQERLLRHQGNFLEWLLSCLSSCFSRVECLFFIWLA